MLATCASCFLLPLALAVACLAPVAHGSTPEGEAFLAKNREAPGVVALPSGLQYKVLRRGTGGFHPTRDSPCECHYAGTLITGEKFDSSYDRGSPTTFAPSQVIKGWTEAMQLMVEGDKWQLFIPSQLAYGQNPRPGGIIKPGDVLVFEIEIIKIKGGKVPAARRSDDSSPDGDNNKKKKKEEGEEQAQPAAAAAAAPIAASAGGLKGKASDVPASTANLASSTPLAPMERLTNNPLLFLVDSGAGAALLGVAAAAILALRDRGYDRANALAMAPLVALSALQPLMEPLAALAQSQAGPDGAPGLCGGPPGGPAGGGWPLFLLSTAATGLFLWMPAWYLCIAKLVMSRDTIPPALRGANPRMAAGIRYAGAMTALAAALTYFGYLPPCASLDRDAAAGRWLPGMSVLGRGQLEVLPVWSGLNSWWLILRVPAALGYLNLMAGAINCWPLPSYGTMMWSVGGLLLVPTVVIGSAYTTTSSPILQFLTVATSLFALAEPFLFARFGATSPFCCPGRGKFLAVARREMYYMQKEAWAQYEADLKLWQIQASAVQAEPKHVTIARSMGGVGSVPPPPVLPPRPMNPAVDDFGFSKKFMPASGCGHNHGGGGRGGGG